MPVQVDLGTGVAHSKRGGLGGWSVADPGSGEHNVGEGETIESQRQGWTGGCTCDGWGGESRVVVVEGGGFAVRHAVLNDEVTASDSALLQRLSLLSGAPSPVGMPGRPWMGGWEWKPGSGGSATLSAMRSSGQTPEGRARSPKTPVETGPMSKKDTTCVTQRRGHAELPLAVFMPQCPSERHPARAVTQQPPAAPNTARWSHRRQGTEKVPRASYLEPFTSPSDPSPTIRPAARAVRLAASHPADCLMNRGTNGCLLADSASPPLPAAGAMQQPGSSIGTVLCIVSQGETFLADSEVVLLFSCRLRLRGAHGIAMLAGPCGSGVGLPRILQLPTSGPLGPTFWTQTWLGLGSSARPRPSLTPSMDFRVE
ncbi:hypothetical protein PCL_05544 [Purpureocillium lilacinum]|uniref:Uncharacterized protein n=1 Tax=Purpureocillium lilacinum TaxID=33203 RepID=A0A2U3DUY7_PURLI|nr:hypothetical protein PCL_05544 [Purpureocillium lilacinum]